MKVDVSKLKDVHDIVYETQQKIQACVVAFILPPQDKM